MVAIAQEPTARTNASIADAKIRTSPSPIPKNGAIDFAGFVKLTQRFQPIRESRRVPIATFNEMSRDPNTIILDTRSKRAFDLVHVAGAVHLNFSDFTAEKLREVIPSKQTRILIYCNNNFKQPDSDPQPIETDATPDSDRETDEKDAIVEGTTNKLPTLALNIPTFINLHVYGYTNVYELADQLELNDGRLTLSQRGFSSRR
jgi:hypothetical protein